MEQDPKWRLPPRQRAAAGDMARARRSNARAVGSFVPKLTRKAFEKYGFSAATIVTDWTAIVGEELAQYTEPERLKWPRAVEVLGAPGDGQIGRPGATLVVRVDGARALEVQYKARQVIERINGYFGYRAVAELRFLQAPVGRRSAPVRRGPAPTQRGAPVAPAPHFAVTDDGLRSALERLYASVVTESGKPATPALRRPFEAM